MKTIRIGLIGAGGIGEHHAKRYERVAQATFTAVVDVDEERAHRVAEQYGVEHVFTSYEAALDADVMDAADICLPTWLHRDAAVAAARAGKHILCEKPMALSLEEVDDMVQAADDAGVVLMIAQCRRHDNYWGAVARAVAEGAIGRPVVWRDTSGHAGPSPAWFYDKAKGMGPLLDGAIHNYDFARTMFGEAKSVYASGHTFKDVTALDTGIAVIRFEGGDELQLSWSWGLPKGAATDGVQHMMGPEGVLYFRAPRRYEVPAAPEGMDQVVVVRADGDIVPYTYEKNDMYVDEIQNFVNAILGEGDPNPSGADNRASMAIAMAVFASAESGEVVTL